MSVEMSDGVELRGDVPDSEHTAGPAPATPPRPLTRPPRQLKSNILAGGA